MGQCQIFWQREKNQSFNKEMERTLKTIKDKWIPAEIKGKKVRSYYKMPIRMRIG